MKVTNDAARNCDKCGFPMGRHVLNLNRKTLTCPKPVDAPLPKVPANFTSKLRLYNVFQKCKKCSVKKYVNRETKLCLACEGMP